MRWLAESHRRAWPWWAAFYFLAGYEVVAWLWNLLPFPDVLLLSHMAWIDHEAYPPLPWVVGGVAVVLGIHFYLNRARWILPVGLGAIALIVWWTS